MGEDKTNYKEKIVMAVKVRKAEVVKRNAKGLS